MTDPTVYSYYDDDENVAVAGLAVEPPRRGRLSSHPASEVLACRARIGASARGTRWNEHQRVDSLAR
jgi:hypothetical protein